MDQHGGGRRQLIYGRTAHCSYMPKRLCSRKRAWNGGGHILKDQDDPECGSSSTATGTYVRSIGTAIDPQHIGACQSGTQVALNGVMWLESPENGLLVVNVNWRGRSYVGTLMDSTKCDSAMRPLAMFDASRLARYRPPSGRFKRPGKGLKARPPVPPPIVDKAPEPTTSNSGSDNGNCCKDKAASLIDKVNGGDIAADQSDTNGTSNSTVSSESSNRHSIETLDSTLPQFFCGFDGCEKRFYNRKALRYHECARRSHFLFRSVEQQTTPPSSPTPSTSGDLVDSESPPETPKEEEEYEEMDTSEDSTGAAAAINASPPSSCDASTSTDNLTHEAHVQTSDFPLGEEGMSCLASDAKITTVDACVSPINMIPFDDEHPGISSSRECNRFDQLNDVIAAAAEPVPMLEESPSATSTLPPEQQESLTRLFQVGLEQAARQRSVGDLPRSASSEHLYDHSSVIGFAAGAGSQHVSTAAAASSPVRSINPQMEMSISSGSSSVSIPSTCFNSHDSLTQPMAMIGATCDVSSNITATHACSTTASTSVAAIDSPLPPLVSVTSPGGGGGGRIRSDHHLRVTPSCVTQSLTQTSLVIQRSSLTSATAPTTTTTMFDESSPGVAAHGFTAPAFGRSSADPPKLEPSFSPRLSTGGPPASPGDYSDISDSEDSNAAAPLLEKQATLPSTVFPSSPSASSASDTSVSIMPFSSNMTTASIIGQSTHLPATVSASRTAGVDATPTTVNKLVVHSSNIRGIHKKDASAVKSGRSHRATPVPETPSIYPPPPDPTCNDGEKGHPHFSQRDSSTAYQSERGRQGSSSCATPPAIPQSASVKHAVGPTSMATTLQGNRAASKTQISGSFSNTFSRDNTTVNSSATHPAPPVNVPTVSTPTSNYHPSQHPPQHPLLGHQGPPGLQQPQMLLTPHGTFEPNYQMFQGFVPQLGFIPTPSAPGVSLMPHGAAIYGVPQFFPPANHPYAAQLAMMGGQAPPPQVKARDVLHQHASQYFAGNPHGPSAGVPTGQAPGGSSSGFSSGSGLPPQRLPGSVRNEMAAVSPHHKIHELADVARKSDAADN